MVLVGLTSFVPAVAFGQQRDAGGDNDPAARGVASSNASAENRMLELNQAGFKAFSEGDFARAAQLFERAHTFVADPILRKNAAIAWFKAGRCARASKSAISFLLADEMSIKDRIEARSVLGHCRLDRAEDAIADGDIDRGEALMAGVAMLKTDRRVDRHLAEIRRQLGRVRARPMNRASLRRPTTAGWLLVASGAAILAGNVIYHLVSRGNRDRLERLRQSGTHSVRRGQLRDQVDTANWLVPTVYGLGGLATGTGAWLVISADAGAPDPLPTKPAAVGRPASMVQLNAAWTF